MSNILTISIDKAAYGGSGIGFYNGKAIFVPFGLPGEKYEIRIVEEQKDYILAEIINIIEKSEHRIDPLCPNFYNCGGCSYMHIDYDFEIKIKTSVLQDALHRITKISGDMIPPIDIIKGNRYYYRSHCEIKQEQGLIGFYQRNSNSIIPLPVQGCAIVAEQINSCFKKTFSRNKTIKFAIGQDGECLNTESEYNEISEKLGRIIIKRNINSFYQANRFIRENMATRVKEYASECDKKSFLDIFCGVGFFTLYLAESFKEGTGFDINKKTIMQAVHNARLNNITNVNFKDMPSSEINFSRYNPEVIIIDPPRTGLDKKTRKTLLAFESKKIIYVSCNPSTFARDIRDFINAGYALNNLTLIDMFPCTHHIEIIADFIRLS